MVKEGKNQFTKSRDQITKNEVAFTTSVSIALQYSTTSVSIALYSLTLQLEYSVSDGMAMFAHFHADGKKLFLKILQNIRKTISLLMLGVK